nr:unnamed protein product [Digitaria exilis]
MRRRPGIAGLQNAAATRDQFRLVGENVAKVRTDVMKEQLATFRSQLEEFARKHKAEGYVTVEQVEKEFSWSTGRAIDALETLLKVEGLAMIDDGHRDGKRRYWFPCVTVSSDTTGGEAK